MAELDELEVIKKSLNGKTKDELIDELAKFRLVFDRIDSVTQYILLSIGSPIRVVRRNFEPTRL